MTFFSLTAKNSGTASRGFTLVETLVAVAVLMIAVAGPLTVASKGLTGALYSRDQMIASFLAQESMEVVKNTKDNNVITGRPWLQGLTGCTESTPCDASAFEDAVEACSTGGCALFVTDRGYETVSSATSTPFSRYFFIEDIVAGEEVQAVAVVSWTTGLVQNEVRISSLMTALR